MIKKGNKIEAIKIYRELNNVGLAEAIGAWSFWKPRKLCLRLMQEQGNIRMTSLGNNFHQKRISKLEKLLGH